MSTAAMERGAAAEQERRARGWVGGRRAERAGERDTAATELSVGKYVGGTN